jgi:hypothetical protein
MAQSAPPFPFEWERSTEVYTHPHQPRMYSNSPVFLITGTRPGSPSPPAGPQKAGAWHRVDLKPWGIAADAKWAELSGLLIITHGTTVETANLTVSFRRVGDATADCRGYMGQVVEAAVGSGQRSYVSVTVPLVKGEFEWCYTRSTGGSYPTNSSYGVNMVVQKWGR